MSDETKPVLPTDPADRKAIPVVTGFMDYFSAAIAEVCRVTKAGNDQHNPGQPLHWARGKSMDHADCIGRHLIERGTVDTDGQRHSAKLACRAMMLLQEELEAEGAPISRGSSVDPVTIPKPPRCVGCQYPRWEPQPVAPVASSSGCECMRCRGD
jgi:hypothetical protein